MSKKLQFFQEAENMFIYQQLSAVEIAARLKLCEKTIRLWRKEGSWVEKRNNFMKKDLAFHEELYEFSKKLMRLINNDIDNNLRPNTGQLYTVSKSFPCLQKSRITKIKLRKKINAGKKAYHLKLSGR